VQTLNVRLAMLGTSKGLLNKTTVTPHAQQELFLLQAPLHAQIVTTDNINQLKQKVHVYRVQWASTQALLMHHTVSA
jgi:hypothetical protein